MNNKEVFNESFFKSSKKKNFSDFKKSLPTYKPVDAKRTPSYTDALSLAGNDSFSVKDSNEIKKRLSGTFGATFGNNTVKTLASRSIKKFPIVVSDAVDPNTVVLLKKLLEDQVAEYINLLISNQVIDLSAYQSASPEDGNIALQALDQLTAPEFSRQEIANKATQGRLKAEDIFNSAPLLYSLIRNEEEIRTGNPVLDDLLENAIVIPSESSKEVVSYLNETYREITDKSGRVSDIYKINEINPYEKDGSFKDPDAVLSAGDPDFDTLQKDIHVARTSDIVNPTQDAFLVSRVNNWLLSPFSGVANILKSGGKTAEEKYCEIFNFGKNEYDKLRKFIIDTSCVLSRDDVIGIVMRTKNVSQQEAERIVKDTKTGLSASKTTINNAIPDAKEEKADEKEVKATVNNPAKIEKTALDVIKNNLKNSNDPIGTVLFGKKLDNTAHLDNKQVEEATKLSKVIADRYAKAVVLLESQRISGIEFVDYCAIRLGIPFTKEDRARLIMNYRFVRDYGNPADSYVLSVNSGERIGTKNYKEFEKELLSTKTSKKAAYKLFTTADFRVANTNAKKVLTDTNKVLSKPWKIFIASSAAVGGGLAGGALGASVGALISLVNPISLWATAGVGAGAGLGIALGIALYKLREKKLERLSAKSRGWERVEAMIVGLDRQMNDVQFIKDEEDERRRRIQDFNNARDESSKEMQDLKTQYKNKYDRDSKELNDRYEEAKRSYDELSKAIDFEEKENEPAKAEDIEKLIAQVFEEGVKKFNSAQAQKQIANESEILYVPEAINLTEQFVEISEALQETMEANKEIRAMILSEAVISLDTPTNIKDKHGMNVSIKSIKYDPTAEIVVPNFAKSGAYAYGSVEYDRKENKDRRFNAPLIMTVNFRGKYSDGRTSDNELTAVIGILGVVNRIPSEEMKYILKTNAEGQTLEGILRGEGDIKGTFADILTGTKFAKDLKNLPQSGEIWRNLEKVAQLAVANKMRGSSKNNVSNAHLIFAQKEIDELRGEENIDYIRDKKLSAQLLKRYSAFTLMIANDAGERVYIFDDIDNISWNVVPYSALQSKGSDDQLVSALSRLERGRI